MDCFNCNWRCRYFIKDNDPAPCIEKISVEEVFAALKLLLKKRINWVLSDKNRHKELCIKAREKAVACFDIETIARRYAELYREVLG